jgi:hypothetical protein
MCQNAVLIQVLRKLPKNGGGFKMEIEEIDDADIDQKYQAMLDMIDKALFTKYRERRGEICSLFTDKTIDLNQHRELIAQLAMFNVNETDRYWAHHND